MEDDTDNLVPILGGILDGEQMAPIGDTLLTYAILKVGEDRFFEHEYELRVIKFTCTDPEDPEDNDDDYMDFRFVETAVRAFNSKEAAAEYKKKRASTIFLRIDEDETGEKYLAQYGVN